MHGEVKGSVNPIFTELLSDLKLLQGFRCIPHEHFTKKVQIEGFVSFSHSRNSSIALQVIFGIK